MPAELETVLEKAGRHLGEIAQGYFDPLALWRAPHELLREFLSLNERSGWLCDPKIVENYLGIEDLTRAIYTFEMPAPPYVEKFKPTYCTALYVIEFPLRSKIDLVVTPLNRPLTTQQIIAQIPKAIAAFTGPTFLPSTNYLPNNGFYYRDDKTAYVEFKETNPVGDKRGAFGLTEKDELLFLTDPEKWQRVAEYFRGLKVMIGTANYYTELDEFKAVRSVECHGKGNLSYLLKYCDQSARTRVCFGVSLGRVSRATMQTVLNDYVDRRDGNRQFGIELEQGGASCILVDRNGRREKIGGEGYIRRDHYFVTLQ